MRLNLTRLTRFVLPVLAGLGMAACSVEKDTFVSRNWHNLLAHYNSYFIAREKLKEVELSTWKSVKDDYNRPLAVLPPPGQAATQTTVLDEIVKKASIPVQRHKNSDWVDDSYLLVGRARYYQDDYENATHTFRYLVAKAKDENVKHAALVWLLRTYTDMKEYSYARQATEAALASILNNANRKDFYLAMAHYHAKFREWPEVLGYVEEALPLMRRDFYRARMEFLAGQLRQRMGEDSAAYQHFKMVARCKPSYELGFNAQVSAAQTLATNDEAGVRKIRKYFKKQLKDEKNLEYKDKIYYEMARFELKQNEPGKSIEYANASLRSNGTTTGMKGYTYLLEGRVYYEKYKRFDLAKLYYDSAVAAMDTSVEGYKAIVKRQKVLGEFVAEYEVIQREDSLRSLAALDSNALTSKLTAMATTKVRRDAELAKQAEKEARRAERDEANRNAAAGNGSTLNAPTNTAGQNDANTPGQPTGANGVPLWYFYNPSQVARGKALFTRKWGRRPLEDNWRRAKKDPTDADEAAQMADGSGTSTAKDTASKGGANGATASASGKSDKPDEKAPAPSEAEAVAGLVKQYREGLPLTPQAIFASDEKLQPALFNIGKIYDQKLEETDNGLASFTRLTKNYPKFDKDPEALYNEFIIYGRKKQQRQADSVKAVLLAKHPESVFARLADDPQFLAKSRAQTEAAMQVYRQAYESYKRGLYIEAGNAIASIRKQYPDNSFKDRVDLLAAILAAKTIDPTAYSDSLKAVAARYPKSDLQPTLKTMIETAGKFGKPATPAAGPADTAKGKSDETARATTQAPRTGPAQWAPVDGPQIFVAVMPFSSMEEGEAQTTLADFNSLFYPQENLTPSTTPFNGEVFLIRAGELRSKLVAKQYMVKQEGMQGAFDAIEPRVRQFLITPENFRELMRTKDIDGYLKYYRSKYD